MPASSSARLLLKGLEEEVYTGKPDGRIVGLAPQISAALDGFHTEPDARNVEYITAPHRDYRALLDELMSQRCRLRRYLHQAGNYTLVPGSALALEPDGDFHISDPNNPYYRHIRDTYGPTVVTASTHINIGIEDPETLMRAYRVFRCESPIFLALTASSPFLHGQATGYHSTRWHVFPHTPAEVPFFRNHAHFVEWFDHQLAIGTMNNSRHLWVSARPNGPATPRDLNRLELRICDRISQPSMVSGMTALAEARVRQLMDDPELDPLAGATSSRDWDTRNRELMKLCRANEEAVAKSSLDAEVIEWQTGETMTARQWAERFYSSCLATAEHYGFCEWLAGISQVIEDGCLAQQWIAQYESGVSIASILRQAMDELAELDTAYDPECPKVQAHP